MFCEKCVPNNYLFKLVKRLLQKNVYLFINGLILFNVSIFLLNGRYYKSRVRHLGRIFQIIPLEALFFKYFFNYFLLLLLIFEKE
jgi:hypothetical protein